MHGCAARRFECGPPCQPVGMRLPEALRNSLLDAWALLLPVDCAGCGAADRALCDDCTICMPARKAIVGREGVYLTRPMR